MRDLRVSLVRAEFRGTVVITVSLGDALLLHTECTAQNGRWESESECCFDVASGTGVRVEVSGHGSVEMEVETGEKWLVLENPTAGHAGRVCFAASQASSPGRGSAWNKSAGSSSGYVSAIGGVSSKPFVSDEECETEEGEPPSGWEDDARLDASPAQTTNTRYQELMDTLASQQEVDDLVKVYEELQTIAQDFVDMASHYGHIIISEMHLPDSRKSIKPVPLGGALGGVKYIVHDVVFKVPVAGLFAEYPDPYWASMKVAGHELKGLMSLSSRLTDRIGRLIHLPLTALIDSRGYRVVASSLLPIGHDTLVFGSDNASNQCSVVTVDRALADALTRACKSLNLKEHEVVNSASKTGKADLLLAGPVDLEGHRGRDWRYYAVDFSRMMPPLWTDGRPSHDQFWSLYSLMRSEFVARNAQPLNVDAFSRFAPSASEADVEVLRADQREIKSASSFLVSEYLDGVARDLLNYWGLTARFLGSFSLTQWLQSKGINVRFLGLLCEKIEDPVLRQWIGLEAIARVGKNMLRARLREAHSNAQKLGSSHLIAQTISFCSAFFGIVDEQQWWACNGAGVVDNMQFLYNFSEGSAIRAANVFLQENAWLSDAVAITARAFVLERICAMTGITVDSEVRRGLREGKTGFKGSMFLLGTHDIKFGNRVKHLNLIDYARALILYHQGLAAKDVQAKAGYLRRAHTVISGTLNSSLPDAKGALLAGDIAMRLLVATSQAAAAEADSLKLQATECFQQTVALDPFNVSALCSLAQIKILSGDSAGADSLFQSALKIDDRSEEVLIKYASFCGSDVSHETKAREMKDRLTTVRHDALLLSPLLDPDFLNDVAAEFRQAVSERWMADTRAQMDELRELCDAENWSKVVDIAHAVKGAAAQIGAVRVSLAADKAYLAARDDPPCSFSIVDMVMLLRRAFDSTVMELKRGG